MRTRRLTRRAPRPLSTQDARRRTITPSPGFGVECWLTPAGTGHVVVINHPPQQRWSPGLAAVLSFFVPGLVLHFSVEHFSSITLTNAAVTSDILGDAYEVLIKRFAEITNKKAGEF